MSKSNFNELIEQLEATGDGIAISPVGFALEKPKTNVVATNIDIVVADKAGNNGYGSYRPAALKAGNNIAIDYESSDNTVTISGAGGSVEESRCFVTSLQPTDPITTINTNGLYSNFLVYNYAPIVAGQRLILSLGNYTTDTFDTKFRGKIYKLMYATPVDPVQIYDEPLRVEIQLLDKTDVITPLTMNLVLSFQQTVGTTVNLIGGSYIEFVIIKQNVDNVNKVEAAIINANTISLISS